MCKILDEYERIGVERGRKEGRFEGMRIQKFITENIEHGMEQSFILDEIVQRFSVSKQMANEYYEVAIGD